MLNALSDKIAQLAVVLGLLAQAIAASPAIYEISPNAPESGSGEQTAVTTNLTETPVVGHPVARKPLNQGEIRSLIVKYARKYKVPDVLALAISKCESNFD